MRRPSTNAASIATFEATRQAAFDAERAAWQASGEFGAHREPHARIDGARYDRRQPRLGHDGERAVEHLGDNKTGAGEGDDEAVNIDLTKIPADVKKLVFAVTIHEAEARGQNFGQVSNAYMRVVNAAVGAVLAKYDLSEDYSTETAMIFGEIYRHNDEWKMKAIGAGFAGGLGPLASSHGVNLG